VQKLAACATSVAAARRLAPGRHRHDSRRWFWICSQADSTGEPIVGLSINAPASPFVGTIAGLPVLISDGIPPNTNGDQDVIIEARSTDVYLQEAPLHVEVMLQTNPIPGLSVGVYLAFTAAATRQASASSPAAA
jgi:hypothetical protein